MVRSFEVLHVVDHMGDGGVQSILRNLSKHSDTRIQSLREVRGKRESEENFEVTDSESPYNFRCLINLHSRLGEEVDILHCHLLKSKLTGFLMSLLPWKDFKLVFHEHGDIYRDGFLYAFFLNLANFKLDAIIAVSDHTAELLDEKTQVEQDKIEVLYNFTDRGAFKAQDKGDSELGILEDSSEEYFAVGFLARLIERKGWKTVIEAAENIQNQNTRFFIAGEGPDKEKIVQRAQKLENLEYLGRVKDTKDFYKTLDCFILPSYWDPCPITLYEAQASETPLICSDAPAINEIVRDGKNCLMFETKNWKELNQKIRDLRNNQELHQKITRNQTKFSKRNNVERYMSDLEKIYEKILDK